MREIWLAALTALSLAAAVPALAQAPPRPPLAATNANLLALSTDDRILGKRDAPITIVEYASLTCPHCAHFAVDVLPKLKADWIDTGKAKLVLRDYPLDEPALRAAMLARCAPPDRFYVLIDTIFETQEKWARSPEPLKALEQFVLLRGMKKDQIDACLADKAVEDKVLQSRLVATQQLDVNSTPTFFINGTKFESAPEADALDAALKRAAGS